MPIRNGIECEYFDCTCWDSEHVLRVIHDPDDTDEFFSIEIHLDNKTFFKRIWIGLKYIFGFRSRYGAFGCWVLHKDDTDRMIEILQKVKGSPWFKHCQDDKENKKNEETRDS